MGVEVLAFPRVHKQLSSVCNLEKHEWLPGRELIDFYDGGDHVSPFSQTPKYVYQIFQRPQIC